MALRTRLSIPVSGCSEPVPQSLEIVVVHTKTRGTLQALKAAGALAHNLHGRIRMIATQVVPYPLPLSAPHVSPRFASRQLSTMVDGAAIPTSIDLLICRDASEAVLKALAPSSIVVMGGLRTWYFSAEKRLARLLTRKGHQVILSNLD